MLCANTGPVIKAAKLCTALLFLFNTPQFVLADSTIQGTVVNTPAKIENSANIAAGSNNKAAHSSIVLKNTRVGGAVANNVQTKNSVNIAVGKRNVANQGSVAISRGSVQGVVVNNVTSKSTANMAVGKDNQANQSAIISNNSRVSGKLLNSSAGNAIVNMAIGNDNKADQGSIRIENSRVRGTVINSATLQKSANIAVGDSNSASQAAITTSGTQLRGKAVNKTSVENAVNAAVGFKNEASQSSIVIDGDEPGRAASISMPQTSFPDNSDSTELGLVNLLPATGGKAEPDKQAKLAPAGSHSTQGAEKSQSAAYVPGQVIFLVDNDKGGLASLDRVAQKYKLNIGEKTVLKSLNRIMVVSSTARDAAETAEALANESGVYNSQPNYIFATMGVEDPLSSMQNLVSLLDLQKVHRTVTGKNITVAVVDTGVDVEHQDLQPRIAGYQNFISDSAYQGEIHGTAVAGIIGADQNELGIVGIAPEVSLLALRACRQVGKMSAVGECFSTSLVSSLDAAISAKADVVNLSLGAHVNDTLVGMMIDSGHERGMVFAAPVGNDVAAEDIAFPASHDKVISIAGLDEQGNPLPNQRLASMADAVAPATHLFATTPGNSYNFIDGTSLASASISGIIALSMEKKIAQNRDPCLPRFNRAGTWSQQVRACIGL